MSQEDRNKYWDRETSDDILMTLEYRRSLIQTRIKYAEDHYHFKEGDKVECLNIFKPTCNDNDEEVMLMKKPRLLIKDKANSSLYQTDENCINQQEDSNTTVQGIENLTSGEIVEMIENNVTGNNNDTPRPIPKWNISNKKEFHERVLYEKAQNAILRQRLEDEGKIDPIPPNFNPRRPPTYNSDDD